MHDDRNIYHQTLGQQIRQAKRDRNGNRIIIACFVLAAIGCALYAFAYFTKR